LLPAFPCCQLFSADLQKPDCGAAHSSPPAARFTDVAAAAGLAFRHENGSKGEKLLPETMGGGCAILDFDADGDQDILLINGKSWPWDKGAGPEPTSGLFQNDGSGRFKDVTAGSGLDSSFYGMGVAIGDYDNDGQVDLFLTGVGSNRLFRNQGGKFAEVTSQAGLEAEGNWGTSAGFADYNNDGRLDIFVCNYVKWSRELDQQNVKPVPGVGRVYGPPFAFEGTHPFLYRNEGGGRFTEVSEAAGLRRKDAKSGKWLSKSLGVAPVDLDGDGWMDFVVANDTVPNQVFHNQKDGTFKEIGNASGLAYDAFGNVRGAMGIDTAWFGDDASLGVAIANFANEMNGFYVAAPGSLRFADEGPHSAIGPSSRALLKFGLIFFDYDLDGWPDLLTANGHLDAELARAKSAGGASAGYAQPAQLFWNGGPKMDSPFVPVTEAQSGPDLFKPIVGRGAAYGDIDGDGDLDVLLTQIGGPPLLLRNDLPVGRRFLRVKLEGSGSNRNAVGAQVTLRSRERIWRAQAMPTRSYLSQCELPITFGIGTGALPETLEVRWPSGKVQTLPFPTENRITLREPKE